VVCTVCIYIGVVVRLLLPLQLWDAVVPTMIPRAVLPNDHEWIVMVTAIPLTIHAFTVDGYTEWQTSDKPIIARMIYACNAGVSSLRTWFQRLQRHAH
jgi:hypothetical protein